MSSSDDPIAPGTDALVRRLTAQAGAPARGAYAFPRALVIATPLALVAAVLVVASLFGLRTDLASLPASGIFWFKVAAMALLCAGAIRLVRRCGVPGLRTPTWPALLPTLLVLLSGVALDRTGFPLSGARDISIPVCVLAIITAGLPGLGLLLLALRRGIPTRPMQAGATAGLAAGTLGALAYTLSCINDGASFVALWYTVAVALSSALGALLGRRVLRW